MQYKSIDNLPLIEWIDLKTVRDSRRALLCTTVSAEKLFIDFLKSFNFVKKIYIESADELVVNKIIKDRKTDIEVIYALGGGKVNDVARYIAYKWKIDIISIPTILSTDAFLVNCTGLRSKGCVKYIPSKKATKVFLDLSILKKSSPRYHLSGCGDVLSIYTALFDWKYTIKKRKAKSDEKYSPFMEEVAMAIFNGLLLEAGEIKRLSKKGFTVIVNSLAMEVQLCNLYGNSRPEEGGEHFFTYCIENKLQNFLHGEMVSFGVLLTSFLQKQKWLVLKNFMDVIGLNYKPDNLNKSIVLETLNEMQAYVRMHKLRYSIYNDFIFDDKKKQVEKFLNILEIF